MRKLNILILSIFIIFNSCTNLEDPGSGGNKTEIKEIETKNTPDSDFKTPHVDFYTISSNQQQLSFDAKYNGKKAFIIYSNETSLNITIDTDNISFNQNSSDKSSITDNSKMNIYTNAVPLGNGLFRNEVQFYNNGVSKGGKITAINSRAAANPGYYNNHNPDSNNKSKFWAIIDSSQIPVQVDFELKYLGQHCRIWVADNTPSVNINTIDISNYQNLARIFDAAFPKEIAVFGSNAIHYSNTITANESTKIDILIYDLFGDANPNATSATYGFFRSTDMFRNNTSTITNSNECELINIDSFCWKTGIDGQNDGQGNIIHRHQSESTLVHEFQHLLNFCNKPQNYSTWFTEMLAMSCEEVLQETIQLSDNDSPKSRFNIYFDKPYLGFRNWPQSNSPNILYFYCNAYAFGTYLIRNYGGIKLIHEIATNNYVDGNAITEALKSLGYNETFESVIRKFGMIYIFTDGKGITLNTEKYQNFNNSVYKLSKIDLNQYFFHKYSNLAALQADQTVYRINNSLYGHDTQNNYYLPGPTIYKNNYKISDSIEPYGFSVYYLGIIQTGNTYSVNHQTNLTMNVVIRD